MNSNPQAALILVGWAIVLGLVLEQRKCECER